MSGPTASSTDKLLPTFNSIFTRDQFVFAVWYRGHWCPFCQAYLTQLAELSPSITAQGGVPLIITAEKEPEYLEAIRKATGYTGEALIDTTHSIAKELKRQEKLDVAISSKGGYEHGMAQPAVLVMKNDGTVLFSWAIVPGMMNLGGAKDRPQLSEVWEDVQLKLQGKDVHRKKYTKLAAGGVLRKKIFG